MYARYGKLQTQPGQRAAFRDILLRGAAIVAQLPGSLAYIVHEDLSDDTALWVYEAWDSQESHAASLKDERIRAVIAAAMPLLGGPPSGAELRIVGGHGLPTRSGPDQ
jgi:quinol monooxygenase YgiN